MYSNIGTTVATTKVNSTNGNILKHCAECRDRLDVQEEKGGHGQEGGEEGVQADAVHTVVQPADKTKKLPFLILTTLPGSDYHTPTCSASAP